MAKSVTYLPNRLFPWPILLACWLANCFAIFLPLLVLAPILGVEDITEYMAALAEWSTGAILFGSLATIPFTIYLGIRTAFRVVTGKNKTMDIRQLFSITYAALGTIVPTLALYSIWYWEVWEYLTTGASGPSDLGQGLGIALLLFLIVIHPIGIVLGSALGFALAVVLEKKGIILSRFWLVLGAIGFIVLMITLLILMITLLWVAHRSA